MALFTRIYLATIDAPIFEHSLRHNVESISLKPDFLQIFYPLIGRCLPTSPYLVKNHRGRIMKAPCSPLPLHTDYLSEITAAEKSPS